MTERKAACLEREMEQLSTQELDRMLQSELRKEAPDENIVLPILKVLRVREADHHSEVTEDIAVAWKDYQDNVSMSKKSVRKRPWIPKAAAVAAAVLLLVIAFPFAVDADGALDVLYRFTDSIVEFFKPGWKKVDSLGEYVFETDNPGLQKVYDAVVEMGITVPVVPMWLPDGYVLEELDIAPIPGGEKLLVKFVDGDESIIIQVKCSESITSTQYEKEDDVEVRDLAQIRHYIMENRGHISVVWINGSVEGMINMTSDMETLDQVLNAIYWRE